VSKLTTDLHGCTRILGKEKQGDIREDPQRPQKSVAKPFFPGISASPPTDHQALLAAARAPPFPCAGKYALQKAGSRDRQGILAKV
jgi:hypothetical protein